MPAHRFKGGLALAIPLKSTWQFSLRVFLCFLPICALGTMALARPSPLMVQVLFCATILVFLLVFTVACFGRSQLQPFAFGFALFGMTYIAIVGLVGDFDVKLTSARSPLLTTQLLQNLYLPIVETRYPSGTFIPANPVGVAAMKNYRPPYLFLWIGHTVISWIVAMFGGMSAKLIHVSRVAANSNTYAAEHIKG